MTQNAQRPLNVEGFQIFKDQIDLAYQLNIVHDLRKALESTPLFSPCLPNGKKMSVRISALGKYGWLSDGKGYRYSDRHPNGVSWPSIPGSILNIWRSFVSNKRMPDCCLLNYYAENTKMGLHVDNDEKDFTWPVLSISLGDDALFRIGGVMRNDKTRSIWLSSGDIVLMGGESRLKYHGIDRIKSGSSKLLKNGGRINLTLRVVD